jgi:hypothetical protein
MLSPQKLAVDLTCTWLMNVFENIASELSVAQHESALFNICPLVRRRRQI